MAVVTLLSDFIDGTSMALAEDTDAADLNAFMTANQGRLWASSCSASALSTAV